MFSIEKTKIIKIPTTKTYIIQKIDPIIKNQECKMDINTFDPTKHSPPNPWIQKLESRINEYYNIQEKVLQEND